MTTEAAHCVAIPPSSMWRLVKCAASGQMAVLFPQQAEDDSREAEDGEATHELGAGMIHSLARTGLVPMPAEVIGKAASNGVIFDVEMYEGALMYADNAFSVMMATGQFSGPNVRIEQRLSIPVVHETQFGTPDLSIFHPETYTLYLYDFKFGFRLVEAFENWQLINYYAGLLDVISPLTPGLDDQRLKVVMRIVQPRAFHSDGPIRQWTVRGSDLRPHINILSSAAHEALSGNPRAIPGDHCYKCPGRHACEAAQRVGNRGMDYISTLRILNQTPDTIGRELHYLERIAKVLEARIDGLRAQAETLARRGENIPFYRMEMGKGRETWKKPEAEVLLMGDLMGKDLRKISVITPKQARDKGIDAATILEYAHTPETGMKLVPDNLVKAAKVFKA